MKKVFGIVLLLLSLCSCGRHNTTSRYGELQFKHLTADSTLHLTTDPHSPACQIQIDMDYAIGTHAHLINDTLLRCGILVPDYLSLSTKRIEVRAAVDSFIDRYMTEYKHDYSDIYRQDPQHANQLNTYFRLKTKVQYLHQDYVTYLAHISYYGGGAHGINQTIARNFNINTGRLLHLNHLFANGYEPKLAEVLKEKLMKKYDVDNWSDLAHRFFFADGHVYAPDNFILGKDYITFIYADSEIAPHSEGEIKLTVDLDELDDILKSL